MNDSQTIGAHSDSMVASAPEPPRDTASVEHPLEMPVPPAGLAGNPDEAEAIAASILSPEISKEHPVTDVPGPRTSAYLNHKIRNICLLLSVMVVFNHSRTLQMTYNWDGLKTSSTSLEYVLSSPIEIFFQHFVSGALGRITNPIFFMASGFLFFFAWTPSLRTWGDKLRKRIYTLLLPYLVWSFIGMLFNFSIFLANNFHALTSSKVRGPVSLFEMATFVFNMPLPGQLWFLQTLMFIMICVPLIAFAIVALRAYAVPVIVAYYMSDLPMIWLDKGAVCFFSLGAALGYMKHHLELPSRKWAKTLVALWLGTAATYVLLSLLTDWDVRFLFRALVLVGVLGIWGMYDLLSDRMRACLAGVAIYRFFIYMGFDPLLTLMQNKYFEFFEPSPWANLAEYLFVPTLTIGICLAVALGLRRWTERFYFFLTGGR